MTDFEKGVRFVVERVERYALGDGADLVKFGDYVMSMEPRPASALQLGSAQHRERRIQAMLCLARAEGLLASDG